MPEIIARIGRTVDRPERLALIRPDGTISNLFARDQTRDQISRILSQHGMTLHADDTVTLDTLED